MFVEGDSDKTLFQLSSVEKESLKYINDELSLKELWDIQERLTAADSNKTDPIMMILQSIHKAKNIAANEEDISITSFIEPLIMEPFFRGFPNTTIHGNGHAIYESHVRKSNMPYKHGLPTRGIRGRVPDRSITLPEATVFFQIKCLFCYCVLKRELNFYC